MELSIICNDQVVSINITNQDIIDVYLQSENKGEFIKQLLDNGFTIGKCLHPIVTTCGCCHKIDELSNLMEPFNTGGNSAKNGQIGEIFASTQFTKRNPHILYEDTAKTEKSGDAIITIDNHLVHKVMVDYKNYDSSIPSDEVSKLVRDLHAQNIDYGILISYKTKISRKNFIDYSIIEGKLIVFVAAYGMNVFSLEMAIQYLQRLHECNVLSISHQVSELVLKGTMKQVTEIYEQIYALSCQHSQHINTMKEDQDKINKMFYKMIMNGQTLLTSMNLLVDKARETTQDIHREPSINVHSYSELNNIVDQIIDKDKDRLYAKRILNITNELTINGYHSDKDNCIHFSDIGKLHITKSKVTMIFYNHSEEDCTFNRKYESVKNDNFYIQLSDEPKKWEIIQGRFTN